MPVTQNYKPMTVSESCPQLFAEAELKMPLKLTPAIFHVSHPVLFRYEFMSVQLGLSKIKSLSLSAQGHNHNHLFVAADFGQQG